MRTLCLFDVIFKIVKFMVASYCCRCIIPFKWNLPIVKIEMVSWNYFEIYIENVAPLWCIPTEKSTLLLAENNNNFRIFEIGFFSFVRGWYEWIYKWGVEEKGILINEISSMPEVQRTWYYKAFEKIKTFL